MHDNKNASSNDKTTSNISGVIEFIGWVTIVSGLIISLYLRSNGADVISSLLPAIGATISGLVFIMGAQITRATIDTANNTKEILKVLSSLDRFNP